MSSLQSELESLMAGRQSFSSFARATHRTWVNLAHHLLRRWRAPVSVHADDLVQELLVACWRCLEKFDPNRGVTVERFVIYNATDKAKKWLHKRRAAYRRDDKSPSRFEVPLSCLAGGYDEEFNPDRFMDRLGFVDATQESEVLRREVLRELPSDDLAFMYYQRCPDIERAAANIFNAPLARLALQVSTLEAARAAVERSIELAAAGAAA